MCDWVPFLLVEVCSRYSNPWGECRMMTFPLRFPIPRKFPKEGSKEWVPGGLREELRWVGYIKPFAAALIITHCIYVRIIKPVYLYICYSQIYHSILSLHLIIDLVCSCGFRCGPTANDVCSYKDVENQDWGQDYHHHLQSEGWSVVSEEATTVWGRSEPSIDVEQLPLHECWREVSEGAKDNIETRF